MERRVGGWASVVAEFSRSTGIALPGLLASALCVRSPSGRRHQPGTGSDAGVLCGAAGEELCALCKRAARTVPRLLAHCLQTLLVQGMGAGQSPKKGREAGSAFARFRVGRFAMPR